ncbi:MAG: cob(I)yrinic acid a,c-diamide adenosyltransferase, partial [Methanosarcina sp.]
MAGGMVYIYTGEGEGKTTNALGLALRAVGHGYSAVIIQFMKGRKYIGEYKIKDRLA